MSHTPGPWKIETGEYSGDNWLVGSLYLGRSNDDDKTYWIHITTDRVHASEMGNADAKDDAALIASSPTLAAEVARLKEQVEAMRQLIKEQVDAMENMPMDDINYCGLDWMRRAKSILGSSPAWDDPDPIADFFTGPAGLSDKDPYQVFGEWAAANGYNVEDDDQLQAAIEAYGVKE